MALRVLLVPHEIIPGIPSAAQESAKPTQHSKLQSDEAVDSACQST
jgi:hypothetical protein